MKRVQRTPDMHKPISALLRGMLITDMENTINESAGLFANRLWLEPTIVRKRMQRCNECGAMIRLGNLAFRSDSVASSFWLCLECANGVFARGR